ncbi:tetratricopeptide repeat protein [Salegentibacter sediminis]|uniref:tetratricopeptide repeat protein n=1 Tax=Salegentibacter sediminis TaxID=1930251 RepID=UPI0009C15A9A|nr:tetratricopeptide repeat protein [Salegentibacter sediminis]
MKNLIYIIFFISWVMPAQNEALFEKANSQYAEGNYEEAISLYEQIIENDETSVPVYYNLGNSHYKLNNVGPSIYYYEKALQLDPNDEDVQNNLDFARNMTLDAIPDAEATGFSASINELISMFSYNTWGVMAIIGSVLLAVFFVIYYFHPQTLAKRIFFSGAVFMFIMMAVSVFFAFKQQDHQLNNEFAIIYVEEAEVRNEPSQRAGNTFTLHEGTKARVLEDFQGWVKLELANGTQGWTLHENLRKL